MTALRPAALAASRLPLADGFGPPPAPRRTRNVAGALVGVLVILVCAFGVALFTINAGHRRSVLVVARPVNAGVTIQSVDLGETRVASDSGVHLLDATQRGKVVGRVAAVNLAPGMLVSLDLLTSGSLVAPNHAVVGLALKAGQLPSGLRPLDHVMIVQASNGSSSSAASVGAAQAPPNAVLVASAQVFAVEASADQQSTVVSVIVATGQAPAVASASARGEISVVLLGDAGG